MGMPWDGSNSPPGMDHVSMLNSLDPMLHPVGCDFSNGEWSNLLTGFVGDHHPATSFGLPPLHEKPQSPDPAIAVRSLPPLSSSTESTTNNGDDACDIFASDFLPDLLRSEHDTSRLYQDLFDILRKYPQMMLRRDFWSPFIHHHLYRCSKDGMAEPLGIVLACISAYSSSVESSFEFVDGMINSQREHLVRDFPRYSDRAEMCLAALHAVCVYQILGIFDMADLDRPTSSNNSPSTADGAERRRREDATKAAELYIPFLLKVSSPLRIALDSLLTCSDDWPSL